MIDLVHPRTRTAFRETCSDHAVVRQICQAFENEGFDPAPEGTAPGDGWYGPGQRRGTFDRYSSRIDWTDPNQVRRVLNVFEEILTWLDDKDEDTAKRKEQLSRHLARDGYEIDEAGRIRSSTLVTSSLDLSGLREPDAILEHLERMSGAMDTDPSLAISGAKALIEATTKTVLDELQESYDDRADVPALVKAAQKALQLHPELLASTTKGVESIKRVLSGLSQIAVSIAELRNEYGTDHGRSRPTTGLGPCHAHLAVGAATTYCRMLLETLAARRAAAQR
ncbi:MAG: abortive infection family protein [Actinomycetota bacterium]|jgi:hypothetical protein|nr:abortive infection family protein [Actinomycetota bacterium]